jgi:hypothetical protein
MAMKTKIEINSESRKRFDEAVAAEKARLVQLAAGKDWYFLHDDFFIPSGPPKTVLPPNIEPSFTMDEICDLLDQEYGQVYYQRSGRYLSVSRDRSGADALDHYRFTRPWIPGGIFPWEA